MGEGDFTGVKDKADGGWLQTSTDEFDGPRGVLLLKLLNNSYLRQKLPLKWLKGAGEVPRKDSGRAGPARFTLGKGEVGQEVTKPNTPLGVLNLPAPPPL